MSVRLVTLPLQEPVTLVEAKAHLRLEETRDDVYVQTLIMAARQYIEKLCWRGLLLQTLELTMPSFRGEDKLELNLGGSGSVDVSGAYGVQVWQGSRFLPYLELPRGHLADVPGVVVTYLDESGVQQTLSPGSYLIQNQGCEYECGRLWLNSWPTTIDRFDAVKVQYSVGWSDPTKIPAPLKQAILLLVSQMYEYRSPEITGTIATTLEFTIDVLTSPYRLTRL